MAAPTLVVFDCDGVLVDSEPLSMRVLLEAIAARGVQLDPATGYDRFLGRSLASICQSLEQDFGVTLDATALDQLRQRLYATFEAELQPIPGIAATLERLDTPFCVASSSQPERIELSLRVTGLWPQFRGKLFSATMVARGKPAPDLFHHAALTMGHSARATVVVEDSPVGLRAAKAAGMRSIAFVGGTHAKAQSHRTALEALNPDAIIDDMTRLPELLRQGWAR
jgi:HAD superfamily hydrolase (TIGR01509 family)